MNYSILKLLLVCWDKTGTAVHDSYADDDLSQSFFPGSHLLSQRYFNSTDK